MEPYPVCGIFLTPKNSEAAMPYSRPIRRFYLTPPSVPLFLVSVVLALWAVLATYGQIAALKTTHAFLILLIAYVVLLVGTLFRGA
jgi:hypothetical protein